MALIDVYDGAYLHPMSSVPSSVKAICGYVSGPAATHIWSTADAAAVRASGREFWAIDVPGQSGFNAATGTAAAQRMIAALPRYGQPKHCPVFMDIEYDAYHANPAGAEAAEAAFRAAMHNAGYPRAYAYAPLAAGLGWGAKYTYSRPASLPAGMVGIQYENDAHSHPGWDASVFDSSLLGAIDQPNPPTQEDDMSAADVQAINNHIDSGFHNLKASMEKRLTDHNAALESKVHGWLADAVAAMRAGKPMPAAAPADVSGDAEPAGDDA